MTAEDRRVAQRLAVRYLTWSTVVLAASGLLGVVLRWSQAVPEARLGDGYWYALMTAHGLGTFVGWAGFAVMGLAWWVLAVCGFPTRRFGLLMARLTWWLMMLGVLGVVVTTLLMEFARAAGASCIIRGLRAVSDFEYEFQMAGMNARLDPSIETVFLMAAERQQFISSRFVKEIARLGGDVSSFVSPRVLQRIVERVGRQAQPFR